MNDQPILTVRGEVISEVDPEIARITFAVTAKDSDRAKALRLLNERASAADKVLARFSEGIETIETSGIRVSPQFKSRKPQERISGYVGVVHHTITVADFNRIGELVSQLAGQDLTDVAGPQWALRPDSPARRRARVEAVRDAVQRARDYAHAIGSELTDLVELADTNLLADGNGKAARGFMAATPAVWRSQPTAPDEFTFDVNPTKQTIQASVEARFRISAPDLTLGTSSST